MFVRLATHEGVERSRPRSYSLDAEDANQAFERGRPIFAAGLRASGLQATPVTRIEVEAVPADEIEKQPELQPA